MAGLAAIQARLGEALARNVTGGREPHVLVVLPSFSLGETLLAHYGARVPALEHRYLASFPLLARIPGCEMVYVSTVAPSAEVMAYMASLLPAEARAGALARFHAVEVPGDPGRSVAQRLAGRPDLLAALRDRIAGRPAFLEPWNVTEHEAALAVALGVPLNGSAPELRRLGFKSEGRRLMRAAGVPVPRGREDVRDAEGVVAAIRELRRDVPGLRGVIVKHDDSGAGDGNAVIGLADLPDEAALAARVDGLPEWYLRDLARGGVVEELVAGERFTSPSVQVDIRPDGACAVLATHEQVLGGPSGQVYMGCRFPADPAYAAELARHGRRVGEVLAREGAVGRFAMDFAAARRGEAWQVAALEINLRKGGTTHPYACFRHLVPGRYDEEAGVWLCEAGGARVYAASDNLVDPAWTGLPPGEAIARVRSAGIGFDREAGRGVVVLMLSGLAVDGRCAYVAIGRDPAEADALAAELPRALG